jgi:hypothetical protein
MMEASDPFSPHNMAQKFAQTLGTCIQRANLPASFSLKPSAETQHIPLSNHGKYRLPALAFCFWFLGCNLQNQIAAKSKDDLNVSITLPYCKLQIFQIKYNTPTPPSL